MMKLLSSKEINRTFTHVTIGRKHKVVSLKPSQTGGVSHVFEDLSQFQHYFHHKPRVARKLAGSAWLSWSGKNYKPGGVGILSEYQTNALTMFLICMRAGTGTN